MGTWFCSSREMVMEYREDYRDIFSTVVYQVAELFLLGVVFLDWLGIL